MLCVAMPVLHLHLHTLEGVFAKQTCTNAVYARCSHEEWLPSEAARMLPAPHFPFPEQLIALVFFPSLDRLAAL